jgi:PAS domain S-box-containing protein
MTDKREPISVGAAKGALPLELGLLYETAPVGLAFLTPDCRYQMVNRHLCEICGLSIDDHIGRTVRETVPQVAQQVENIVQTILRTAKPITGIEVRGQRTDGGNAERVWLTNWYPLVSTDGHVLGVNVASAEITERKRMEAALAASEAKSRELAHTLRNLNESLEQRVEAEAQERVRIWNAARSELTEIGRHMTMGAMVASIAHEVSQPLAAIMANAAAGSLSLSPELLDIHHLRDLLNDIHLDAKRAGEVLNGIRSMFRVNDGAKAAISVNELVREVLAVVRGELDAHQITLRTALTDTSPSVRASRAQVEQVLLNLIVNAIEAMSSSSGRERILFVRSEMTKSSNVQITVEDTGRGIEPGHVDRIFEAFFTTKARGMGMGLSICRSIVESHDGRLTVSAGCPHGSIFCVDLPTTPPEHVHRE